MIVLLADGLDELRTDPFALRLLARLMYLHTLGGPPDVDPVRAR